VIACGVVVLMVVVLGVVVLMVVVLGVVVLGVVLLGNSCRPQPSEYSSIARS
jgi:hypothetical protein